MFIVSHTEFRRLVGGGFCLFVFGGVFFCWCFFFFFWCFFFGGRGGVAHIYWKSFFGDDLPLDFSSLIRINCSNFKKFGEIFTKQARGSRSVQKCRKKSICKFCFYITFCWAQYHLRFQNIYMIYRLKYNSINLLYVLLCNTEDINEIGFKTKNTIWAHSYL